MKTWAVLTFLYAIFTGFFQCSKKKASEKNSILEVLATFTTIAFFIVLFTSKNVFDIELKYIMIIFLKSSIIVVAWLLALYAISRMSISLYSVINLSRIIFSVILSVIFLGERLTATILAGLIIVITGLVLVNLISNQKENKEVSFKIILILLFSCLLNSISAVIDKKVLVNITSSQLQFWFLLFLSLIYWWIILLRNKKVDFKSLNKNYWVLVAAISLAVGDKFLFMANEIPESSVTVMTIIKQFSAIELIILGKILFKEKNIIKKLLCSILIIFGIILTIV